MKIFDKAVSYLSRGNKNTFDELNDWFVAFFGAIAFLVAGYWGLMLTEVVPEFIKVVNQHGISLFSIGLACLLGGFGVSVWFFGCIAARCHTLLYDRWFK
jgi:type IV secretory pathway TrbD component